MAHVDCFLKLSGIDGESTDAQFPKSIEILSWSIGASQSDRRDLWSGQRVGQALFDRLQFTCPFSNASPTLINHLASGKHIASAELNCRKAGDSPQVFQKVMLTDCVVSEVSSGSPYVEGAESFPTEIYSLSFAKIEYLYGKQDAKGKVNALDQKMGYDLKLNKKV
jgi:type VI secretion system secreted protein Hcp